MRKAASLTCISCLFAASAASHAGSQQDSTEACTCLVVHPLGVDHCDGVRKLLGSHQPRPRKFASDSLEVWLTLLARQHAAEAIPASASTPISMHLISPLVRCIVASPQKFAKTFLRYYCSGRVEIPSHRKLCQESVADTATKNRETDNEIPKFSPYHTEKNSLYSGAPCQGSEVSQSCCACWQRC